MESEKALSDLRGRLVSALQEAISNIVKHSQAKEARLELTGTSDHLELLISDNGKDFEYDTERERGLGLLSMRERIRLVGGTPRIRTASSWTEVLALVPLKPALEVGVLTAKATDHRTLVKCSRHLLGLVL